MQVNHRVAINTQCKRKKPVKLNQELQLKIYHLLLIKIFKLLHIYMKLREMSKICFL